MAHSPGQGSCSNLASGLLLCRFESPLDDSVPWAFVRKFSSLISGILKIESLFE